MPTIRKLTPRRASGKMTLDEMNVLSVDDAPVLEMFYGSLDKAEERFSYLWDTGQLRTNPGTRPNAWWIFCGPENLRSVTEWLERQDRSMPSYERDFDNYIATHSEFDDAREAYLRELENDNPR